MRLWVSDERIALVVALVASSSGPARPIEKWQGENSDERTETRGVNEAMLEPSTMPDTCQPRLPNACRSLPRLSRFS